MSPYSRILRTLASAGGEVGGTAVGGSAVAGTVVAGIDVGGTDVATPGSGTVVVGVVQLANIVVNRNFKNLSVVKFIFHFASPQYSCGFIVNRLERSCYYFF
jgi:hypothetical protein